MFDWSSLRWASRDEVGARLLTLLDDPRPVPALRLLVLLSPPSLKEAFCSIAGARDRPYRHRVHALRALVRMGAELPAPLWQALLDEIPPDAPELHLETQLRTSTPELLELVPLARGPLLAPFLALLERRPTEHLRLLLDRLPHPEQTPLVERWLLDRVLAAREGPLLGREELDVCRSASARHADAAQALRAHWEQAPRDREFFDQLSGKPELAALLAREPERLAEAVEALALPPVEQLGRMGPERLRRAVRQAVLDVSFRRRCPRRVDTPDDEPGLRYDGALRVITQIDVGRNAAVGLLSRRASP